MYVTVRKHLNNLSKKGDTVAFGIPGFININDIRRVKPSDDDILEFTTPHKFTYAYVYNLIHTKNNFYDYFFKLKEIANNIVFVVPDHNSVINSFNMFELSGGKQGLTHAIVNNIKFLMGNDTLFDELTQIWFSSYMFTNDIFFRNFFIGCELTELETIHIHGKPYLYVDLKVVNTNKQIALPIDKDTIKTKKPTLKVPSEDINLFFEGVLGFDIDKEIDPKYSMPTVCNLIARSPIYFLECYLKTILLSLYECTEIKFVETDKLYYINKLIEAIRNGSVKQYWEYISYIYDGNVLTFPALINALFVSTDMYFHYRKDIRPEIGNQPRLIEITVSL